jgi:hypothetical protein
MPTDRNGPEPTFTGGPDAAVRPVILAVRCDREVR